MKRIVHTVLITVFGFTAFSQEDTTVVIVPAPSPADTVWKVGGNLGIQFTQSAYSNWQAGGENSFSGNGLFNIFANYDDGGLWKWNNSLIAAYGLNVQKEQTIKTDDRLELESRVDRAISKNWNASALLNFRTQFSNGYESPEDTVRISSFMAPAYALLGLGFTYAPNKKFSAYLSPITAKLTIVNDQMLANEGSFGVEPGIYDSTANEYVILGDKTRWELGAYASFKYNTPLAENVTLQLNADFFMNYLQDDFYELIDVNAGLILFMKVNDYITANLAVNMIYDDDIRFDSNDNGVKNTPKAQFKEVLGVGFAYNFGYQPKEKE